LIVVPDASSVIASVLPDEGVGEEVFRLLKTAAIVAPVIWPAELANSLLTAQRRKRITADEASAFLDTLSEYDVDLVSRSLIDIARHVLPLARKHNLTLYCALYVDLARSRAATLLSFDKAMCAAARKERVTVF